MSGIESCDLKCVAYLIWIHNDDIFVRRLGVWLVDNPGDSFAHGNNNGW